MLSEVRLAPPFRALLPPSPCSPSSRYIKSGSRQSVRLPPEMTPVTEGSAANLQASFCLNFLSPHCQILIFSVTASIPPLCFSLLLWQPTPPPSDTPSLHRPGYWRSDQHHPADATPRRTHTNQSELAICAERTSYMHGCELHA